MNNFDGSTEWTGTGPSGSPGQPTVIKSIIDQEPEEKQTERSRRERLKNKKENRKKKRKERLVKVAHSEPDFLTTYYRFLLHRTPGTAG